MRLLSLPDMIAKSGGGSPDLHRRPFLETIGDPGYAGLEAQKLMAVELMLVPFRTDLKLPDPRWPVGILLLTIFLATS